jgi:hypothetical protein
MIGKPPRHRKNVDPNEKTTVEDGDMSSHVQKSKLQTSTSSRWISARWQTLQSGAYEVLFVLLKGGLSFLRRLRVVDPNSLGGLRVLDRSLVGFLNKGSVTSVASHRPLWK